MSQSKIDCTRSGSAGSNWQLSSLRSLCTIDTRVGSGTDAASRSGTSSMSGGPSSGRTRSQRVFHPDTWRAAKPAGLAEVAEVVGRRVEQVHVGHGVDEGEADAAADVGMVGHRVRGSTPRMTSPRRRSITTKSAPMTSWSSQNT